MNPEAFRIFFEYSDWANVQLCDAAAGLSQDRLDRPFDIGRGTLRKTLMHVWAGEDVWLKRWKGVVETPWPDEGEPISISALKQRFDSTSSSRKDFVLSIATEDLDRVQPYRDSLGTLFAASLRDMMVQGVVHSIHHRAQAVNILRRLGEKAPELDYMMRVRKPV